MIVVVLLVAGWLGWIVRSARIQREAVAAITDAGGKVVYNWEWSDGKQISGGKPWVPAWLVDRIGVDYFGHVTGVMFYSSLGNLPSPKKALPFVEVGHLTRAQTVIFEARLIRNADLSNLKCLTNLQELDLGFCSTPDTEFSSLEPLTSLKTLRLSYGGDSMTDVGAASLQGLKKLETLNVNSRQFSDAGLNHFEMLTNLKELDLAFTQVSDAGLVHLKGLANLTKLNLLSTRVTDAGVKVLQQALPKLKIER